MKFISKLSFFTENNTTLNQRYESLIFNRHTIIDSPHWTVLHKLILFSMEFNYLDMYDYSDKPQMGPNSSDEEEESELPPPSMPPPRLPQQSNLTTGVPGSNPPPPRPEAPCPSNSFRIAAQTEIPAYAQNASSYNSSVAPQTTQMQSSTQNSMVNNDSMFLQIL